VVRVGLETVHGLRGSLLLQEAVIEAVGQFSYFRRGLEAMVDTTGDVDVDQVAAELNASFLASDRPVTFEPMITDELQAAIAEARRALEVTSDGVVNPALLATSVKDELNVAAARYHPRLKSRPQQVRLRRMQAARSEVCKRRGVRKPGGRSSPAWVFRYGKGV